MQKRRLIVTGLIGSLPLPGLTFHYLQYVLGLKAMGHEVHYLEHTGQWNYDPPSDGMTSDGDRAAAYLAEIMQDHGLSDQWTFINHDGTAFGVSGARLQTLCESADALINVTGANLMQAPYDTVPRRVYLDTDPGYVQFRADLGNIQDVEHLARHNVHATFGLNIHGADCTIPTLGLRWCTTVQPIVLPLWPADSVPGRRVCVTVMKWHTYAQVEHGGQVYGDKAPELEKFKDLARRTSVPLELAVLGPGPQDEFQAIGWGWRNARDLNESLQSYRHFLGDAAAEWTIAKSGYVKSRSGWIGDRSAAMLALGRPVVLQATGWEQHLPSGRGLLPFSTLEEAADALEEVWGDYDRHARAAREIAEAHFSAPKVLGPLLSEVLA